MYWARRGSTRRLSGTVMVPDPKWFGFFVSTGPGGRTTGCRWGCNNPTWGNTPRLRAPVKAWFVEFITQSNIRQVWYNDCRRYGLTDYSWAVSRWPYRRHGRAVGWTGVLPTPLLLQIMVVTHFLKMCNTTLRPNFGSKWAIWNKWLVPAYILARYSPGSAGSFLHLGGGVCFIFFCT